MGFSSFCVTVMILKHNDPKKFKISNSVPSLQELGFDAATEERLGCQPRYDFITNLIMS